jgi:uncharacterized protein YdaU (DUF1376 family)
MKPGLCPDMPVLVNDWLSSTSISLMTPAEEGAYFRLLCHAWNESDCTLPDDDTALTVLSRMGADWPEAGKRVRACFVADPARPGRIFNAKQRSIREEQEHRILGAKEHGRIAAGARWAKRKDNSGNTQAMPEQCPSITRAMPKAMLKNASSPVSRLPSPKGKRGAQDLEVRNRKRQGRSPVPDHGCLMKPLSTAERIGLEHQAELLREKVQRLNDDLYYEHDRLAHPELVTEREQLKTRLAEVESQLLGGAR